MIVKNNDFIVYCVLKDNNGKIPVRTKLGVKSMIERIKKLKELGLIDYSEIKKEWVIKNEYLLVLEDFRYTKVKVGLVTSKGILIFSDS